MLFGFVSCSSERSWGDGKEMTTQSGIRVWGVQISDSGISLSGDTGSVSVSYDGTVQVQSGTDSVLVWKDGISMSVSWVQVTQVSNQAISVGSGIIIPMNPSSQDLQNDPEVQKITEDINKIFADIAQEDNN
jgi:hypothetical protein